MVIFLSINLKVITSPFAKSLVKLLSINTVPWFGNFFCIVTVLCWAISNGRLFDKFKLNVPSVLVTIVSTKKLLLFPNALCWTIISSNSPIAPIVVLSIVICCLLLPSLKLDTVVILEFTGMLLFWTIKPI